jgi:hypothetical protein
VSKHEKQKAAAREEAREAKAEAKAEEAKAEAKEAKARKLKEGERVGVVVLVKDRTLTVSEHVGKEVESSKTEHLEVVGDAAITLDGKACELSNIKPADKVTFSGDGNRINAVSAVRCPA